MKHDWFFYFFIIFLLFFSPLTVFSMGNSEKNNAYESELSIVFEELTGRIYAGETDSQTARAELGRLREKYKIPYTDREGVLESIIDRAYDRSITPDEANYYFGMLKDGSLMEYRSRTARARTGAGIRKLVVLLLESMENGTGSVPADMLSVLNNYYDILGMEYDEYYFGMNSLIKSLRDGEINAEQAAEGINSLGDRAAFEQRLAEERSRGDYSPERSGTERAESSSSGSPNASAGEAPSGNSQAGNNSGPPAGQGQEGPPRKKGGTGGNG